MHDHIKTSSLLGLSFYPNSPCVLGMNTTTIIRPLEWGRNTCFQISLSSNTRLCHATSTTPSLTSIVKRINCCNCITSWTSQKGYFTSQGFVFSTTNNSYHHQSIYHSVLLCLLGAHMKG